MIDIFPGIREDFLVTVRRCDLSGKDIPTQVFLQPHILHIMKDTGLSDEDIKKVNALKFKSNLEKRDYILLERIAQAKESYRLKTVEKLQSFINHTNGTVGEIELF